MPHKLFKASIISIGALAASIFISTSAFAIMPRYTGSPFPTPKETQITRPRETSIPGPWTTSIPRPTHENGQTGTCKSRQMLIDIAFKKLYENASKIKSKFDSISGRVQEYYTSKVVPSGKEVPSYDSLVADIQDKKTAAEELLATTQADIGAFSCDSSDPKGQIAKIREDIKNLKKALKDYKESIKTLIKAILSSVQASPAAIPTPSSSPSPASSCLPRPACLNATPKCLMPEPIEGWCPSSRGESEND